jgi:hypothetical protein
MQELTLIARVERDPVGLGKLTIQRMVNMLGVAFLLLSVIQLSSSRFVRRSSLVVIDYIRIGLRQVVALIIAKFNRVILSLCIVASEPFKVIT